MSNKRTISFTPEFKKNLKQLSKKYRSIKADLDPILIKLESGETLGVQITGIEQSVYKLRVLNSSAKTGKRSGFRLIYYLQVNDDIILLSLYSKNQITDLSNSEIVSIIKKLK